MLKIAGKPSVNNKNNNSAAFEKNNSELSFKGYRSFTNENGNRIHRFYLPAGLKHGEVELVALGKDKNGNYIVDEEIDSLTIGNKGYADFNPLMKGFDETNPDMAVGYRFNVNSEIILDNALKTPDKSEGEKGYNIALPENRTTLNVPRQMIHIFPDSFNPPRSSARRIPFNHFGGDLKSITEKIPELKDMGFARIISTPIFGQDNVSSHGYWTNNPYQVTENLGSLSDFKKLQIDLFKNGMGWIADGAFVNEGLEGVHIRDIMLWGNKSPYLHWFETHNIEGNSIKAGILPKKEDVLKYIGIKIVNGPYKINFTKNEDGSLSEKVEKNRDYKTDRPTFIQTFDSRLASEGQMNNPEELIRKYDRQNPEDPNQINNYQDSVHPYAFRVDPKEVRKKCKGNNTGKLRDILFDWTNFKIVESNKDGGASLWVGNKDISKLRFMLTDDAIKNSGHKAGSPEAAKMKAAQNQVQDNISKVGEFWTSETARTLTEYTAKKLAGTDFKETIKKLAGKELPASAINVLEEGENGSALDNLLSNKYNLKSAILPQNIMDGIMSYPPDAIEFAPDLIAVLGSPYFKKLSATPENVSLSRYETYRKGHNYYRTLPEDIRDVYERSDRLFKNQMKDEATDIFKQLEAKLPGQKLLNEDNELTDLGRELYGLVAADIAKFLFVSALAPDITPGQNNSFLEYDPEKLKNVNSISLGLYNGAASPKDMAERLLEKLESGVANIKPDLKTKFIGHLTARLKGIDLDSILVSKLIIDTTESGLEWRIDAAKDVGDWESVDSKALDRNECWDNVISFWKKFNEGVRKHNPRAYIIGETTDVEVKSSGRFKNNKELELKFIEEAGFTTQTNYNYFYMSPHEMYASNVEFHTHQDDLPAVLEEKLMHGWGNPDEDHWHSSGFLFSGHIDNIMYSHLGITNHDKPRPLHLFALDAKKFHFKDQTKGNMAGAMADALKKGFENSNTFNKELESYKDVINGAVDSLSKGKYSFKTGKIEERAYDEDNFGVRPFDINIEDVIREAKLKDRQFAEYANQNPGKIDKFKAESLQAILEPAMKKYKAALTLLTAMPGNPTHFAGDELGESGFETKSKNLYQQNRNRLHRERLHDPNYEYINNYRDEVINIIGLRNKQALSPLINGHLIPLGTIPLVKNDENTGSNAFAAYRYNDKTDVIMVFHNYGFNSNPEQAGDEDVVIKEIKNLPDGIQEGTVYKNVNNPDDKADYVVEKDNSGSFIIKRNDGNPIKFKNAALILARKKDFRGKVLVSRHGDFIAKKQEPAFCGRSKQDPRITLANLRYRI